MHIKVKERKYIVIAVVFLLVAVLACVILGKQVSDLNARLALQDQELMGLVNTLSVQQAAVGEANNQTVTSATGLDLDRKAADDRLARELVESVTTWADYDAYKAMRTDVLAKYKIDSSSSFAKIFLPNNPMGLSGRDENYSCRFSGMTTQVSNIRANEYSYFSTVNAIAAGPLGGNKTITVIFLYKTIDGELTSLQAYTL